MKTTAQKTVNLAVKLAALILAGVMSSILTGCGIPLNKDAPNPITLERDYQNVVHYNCSGQVASQGIETISSPTQTVTINPNDPGLVTYATFVDQQTGATPGLIVGNNTFTIDYSYGALNMHVTGGENDVKYTFYGTNSTVLEQGTLTINVNYVEKTLPGSVSVNDCPTPSPSPSPTPH